MKRIVTDACRASIRAAVAGGVNLALDVEEAVKKARTCHEKLFQNRKKRQAAAQACKDAEAKLQADLEEASDLLQAANEANLEALKALGEELSNAWRAVTRGDCEALQIISRYLSRIKVIDTQPIHARIHTLNDQLKVSKRIADPFRNGCRSTPPRTNSSSVGWP
jgi:hypothetical protein